MVCHCRRFIGFLDLFVLDADSAHKSRMNPIPFYLLLLTVFQDETSLQPDLSLWYTLLLVLLATNALVLALHNAHTPTIRQMMHLLLRNFGLRLVYLFANLE
jgi:hypothetical protein